MDSLRHEERPVSDFIADGSGEWEHLGFTEDAIGTEGESK